MEIQNKSLLPSGVIYGKRDPDSKSIKWGAPNDGRYPVAHVDTFLNRYSSLASVYRNADEAMLDSHENSRSMLNDVGIRECLDSRQRSVALLNWHIEPEDEQSPDQVAFCGKLEKVCKRITHFYKYRLACQEAIWYGKAGIQHRWGAQIVENQSVWMPTPRHQDDMGWQPLNGDKLVFRQKRPHGQMQPGQYEGQVGIRVGSSFTAGDVINGRWKVEQVQPTDYGLGYFLSPAERRLLLIHKHNVKDAAYEDGLRAGLLYGEGIRSVIYWEWFQKQQTMAFLMEFMERMAGGIQIWKYPQGNRQAEAEVKTAAEQYNSGEQHILLVPVPAGDASGQYSVDLLEPGFGGIETLHELLTAYYGHRIKRYILGQVLSSESEATGLGSGVAELHADTLLQILKSDATNLEETLTSDLLGSIIRINVQKGIWMDPGFIPRFVIETEDSDVDAAMNMAKTLHEMGMDLRKTDLYEMAGFAAPGPDDDVLKGQQGGGGQGGMGGDQGGGQMPFGPQTQQEHEQEQSSEHAGGAPRDPSDTPQDPDKSSAMEGKVHRYERRVKSPFTKPAGLKGIKFRRGVTG